MKEQFRGQKLFTTFFWGGQHFWVGRPWLHSAQRGPCQVISPKLGRFYSAKRYPWTSPTISRRPAIDTLIWLSIRALASVVAIRIAKTALAPWSYFWIVHTPSGFESAFREIVSWQQAQPWATHPICMGIVTCGHASARPPSK